MYEIFAMNQKEWKTSGRFKGKFEWYNKTRKIQKSLCYEQDPNAKVIHHLRDTEEQRKYNDEHYELWGFEVDEDGNEHFEYGKYVVFWTKEHHDEYHSGSEETLYKRSKSLKGKHHTEETKKRLSETHSGEGNPMYGRRGELCPMYGRRGTLNHNYGKHRTDETKMKISNAQKGEKHWNYGGHLSDEQKKAISEFHSGRKRPKETCTRISESLKEHYKENPHSDEVKDKISNSLLKYFSEHTVTDETRKKLSDKSKGRAHKDESKLKISVSRSEYLINVRNAYREYKANNGTMKWVEFCKDYAIKHPTSRRKHNK